VAVVFQTACTSSGDWDTVTTDAGCALTFNTPTAGRMRAVVDSSAADTAVARKLSGTSCTNFTLAVKGFKLVQHGGAALASAAIIFQLQDGFNTYIEGQVSGLGAFQGRSLSGGPISSTTINGTTVAVDDGLEHDLLLQGEVNSFFRYYVDGVLIHNSTGISGGAALNMERISAGLVAVPITWTGTDMIVEMDEITWTDGSNDDPYGWLSAPASVRMLTSTGVGT
jgi:hypothetical protein